MTCKTSPHKHARSPQQPLPELSDEAAYLMKFFLEDFYLWFSCAYGPQIQRYYQPWYEGPKQSPYQYSGPPEDDPF